MICPCKFSRLHRCGWSLSFLLYILALVSVFVERGDTVEMIMKIYLCFDVYIGMIIVIEILSWWIRTLCFDGIFRYYAVDIMMTIQREPEARDVMYNMAVWPIFKAHQKCEEWKMAPIFTMFVLFVLGIIPAIISLVFAY